VVRDAYVEDCQRGVDRWNRVIREAGIQIELRLPHRRFHRSMGMYAGHHFDPEGRPVSDVEFNRRRFEWLPSDDDRAYIKYLMQPVLEQGKMANWIAAPETGINGRPVNFEYIRRA